MLRKSEKERGGFYERPSVQRLGFDAVFAVSNTSSAW